MKNVEKINTKVTFGEMESGESYIVDLVKNPVVSIVGGSGVGKSNLIYGIVDSLVKTNTPETLNVVLFDEKVSTLWKGLVKESNFTGYHTDTTKFTNVLEEVKSEHERRVKELASKGLDSWEDYVPKDTENDMPMILVVIDELTATMAKFKEESAESHTRFRELLLQLSGVIRTTGIKLVIASQRAIDSSIPKGYLANTSLKVGMKMFVDYDILFDNVLEKESIKLPQSRRECIVTSCEYPSPVFLSVPEVTILRKYNIQ